MSQKLIRKSQEQTPKETTLQKVKSTPADAKQYLGKFQEIPYYEQDNKHILNGYRLNYTTPKKVLKSLFMIHNQTNNIWSHLIGTFICIFFIFQCINYQLEKTHVLAKYVIGDFIPEEPLIANSNVPSWPLLVMLTGGALCLASSATYHLIFPISQRVWKVSISLDYAGIGINMAFSPVPAFYYAFYCQPEYAIFYNGLNITAGTISFAASMTSWLHKQENLRIKIVILSVSSISCFTGLCHIFIREALYQNFGDGFSSYPGLYFFIPCLMCYGVGFYTYVRQCPERYNPGKFDICGHSHQIWHTFVAIAVILTYLGSLLSFELRTRWSTCPATLEDYF